MPHPEPSTSGTTRDVPVVPNERVHYEALPPAGPAHSIYRVQAAAPAARNK